MGVAIAMLVDEALGAPKAERLAIASCGNAAMGAGVIAAAMQRPLDVYVPTWADATVVSKLTNLGSNVNPSERREGEVGDPAYLRFQEAVQSGARAFSVQGTDMWAWDDPQSFATGILDDVTYDWLPLLKRTHATGGEPVVADESLVVQAHELAHEDTEVPVCSTGSSGLAGLIAQPPVPLDQASARERVVLLFTGIDRS